MKTPTPGFLAACAAILLAAAPSRAQQALHVDTSGHPTTPLNLGGANIVGTLPASHLPTSLGTLLPAPLQRGLVAEYRLDEGMGNLATNYARVGGGGVPANLFYAGDEILQAGGPGYTPRYALDPFGGSMAARSTVNTALYPVQLASGVTYTMSVYLASNTGAAQKVRMYYESGYTADLTVPATGWHRLVQTFTTTAINHQIAWFSPDAEGDANDLLVYGAQVETGGTASAYLPALANLGWPNSATVPAWSGGALDFSAAGGTTLAILPNTNVAQVSLYVVMRWPAANAAPNPGNVGLFGSGSGSNQAAITLGGGNGTFTFGTRLTNRLTNLKDGNWHLLSGVYDGTDLRLWIDDTEMAAAAGTEAAQLVTFLEAGCLGQSSTYGFPGQVAYASFYNVGHTTAQQAQQFTTITALMAAKGITLTGLPAIVVFEGDSITAGNGGAYNDTQGTNDPYPNQLVPNLVPITQARSFAVASATIAGVGPVPSNSLAARAPLVNALPKPGRRNVLVVLAGINDAAYETPAQSLASLQAYCVAARAAGYDRIVCGTLLPTARTQNDGTSQNIWRDQWNTLFYAGHAFCDQVMDFAANPTMGPDAACANPTYYADGTHPNGAGHAILAPIAQAAIAAALQ